MTDQLLTDLRRTREIIEAGWTQGRAMEIRDGKRCYCILGGSQFAVAPNDPNLWRTVTPARMDRYRAITLAVKDCLPKAAEGIIATWNDKPGRTKQEVLDLLDDAIAHRLDSLGKCSFCGEQEHIDNLVFANNEELVHDDCRGEYDANCSYNPNAEHGTHSKDQL